MLLGFEKILMSDVKIWLLCLGCKHDFLTSLCISFYSILQLLCVLFWEDSIQQKKLSIDRDICHEGAYPLLPLCQWGYIQLSLQYASSPGSRAHWYAELAVSYQQWPWPSPSPVLILRLRNDRYCVEWGVKLHSPVLIAPTHMRDGQAEWHG